MTAAPEEELLTGPCPETEREYVRASVLRGEEIPKSCGNLKRPRHQTLLKQKTKKARKLMAL